MSDAHWRWTPHVAEDVPSGDHSTKIGRRRETQEREREVGDSPREVEGERDNNNNMCVVAVVVSAPLGVPKVGGGG